MSRRTQPMPDLEEPKIHTHTHRDVTSPSTAPLLGFLLHFAKNDLDYLDVIKKTDPKKLWGIGRNSMPKYCGPCLSDDGKKRSDDEVQDESAQDKDELLDIVNGTGLPPPKKKYDVTIVGGGVSGLVAAYELKRSGFNVHILEASSRVGGRVITFRDPFFAPGLHAEGGAMRIPKNHYLLHAYIKNFNIDSSVKFEMKNKFIYLSGYLGGSTLKYDVFDEKLKSKDKELLKLFPNLKPKEKGKTCDQLFADAVAPVVTLFKDTYKKEVGTESQKIHCAYQAVTNEYDRYSLRSYLKEVAEWSPDALRLFDIGNAHVVFENAFIESWKDAFLSSNTGGKAAEMTQLQNGMDQVPKAFLDQKSAPLAEDITYGARVTNIADINQSGDRRAGVRIDYETAAGDKFSRTSDFVVLSVPYTAQRAITKSIPFSPVVEQAIRDVRYVEVTKILLQYQNRWWEKVFSGHDQGTDGGLVSDLPIRYTMFPKTEGKSQAKNTRGVVMAAYTFQQDATILGSMSAERQVRVAAKNLDQIFPSANSLQLLEAGVAQVFPSDEMAGGSAFCYFAPGQKSEYLATMCQPAWPYPMDSENFRVFFAGEHTSYTHGWIHGAMEAGLRCVQQVHKVVEDAEKNSC